MRERMFHMVNLMVEHLLKENSLSFYEPEMADLLRSHGYEPDEISEALHWLHHFGPEGESGIPEREGGATTSFRTLGEEERLALAPEAHGYLLHLEQMGLIDDAMREEILQQALSLVENEITRDDIRAIALLVAFHRSQKNWQTDLIRFLQSENRSFLH
ncbi:MAG: DUF494 family protein [Nitrospinota bacterium]